MARPKTDFRNEVKSRLRDGAYEALQQYMEKERSPSEARAISDLLELALFGTVGSIPTDLVHSSHETAQSGPKTIAGIS